MAKHHHANEYTCPRCGNTESGNVDPERVIACSYCTLLGVRYVENHPDKFGIAPAIKKPHKFRGLGNKKGKNGGQKDTLMPKSTVDPSKT